MEIIYMVLILFELLHVYDLGSMFYTPSWGKTSTFSSQNQWGKRPIRLVDLGEWGIAPKSTGSS